MNAASGQVTQFERPVGAKLSAIRTRSRCRHQSDNKRIVIDLVRGLGKNVVSSCDLVALFEATLTDEQIKSHFAARDAIDPITAAAFREIGQRARNGGTNEYEMQQWILEAFHRENLVADDMPVVAVNANSGDPHYSPHPKSSKPIREGDFVLLDIWAKKNTPGAVYYDITWTGFVGKSPSDRMQEIFNIVRQARDLGVKTVKAGVSGGKRMAGWEVDRAVRDYINDGRLRTIFHSSHWTLHCAPMCMPTARTWTTWKFTMNEAFCPTPCSPWNLAFICRSLECASK